MLHTQESIYRECKKFKIGDRVTFTKKEKNKDMEKDDIREGKVVERYPHLLVIAYLTEVSKVRTTSFSYTDVVVKKLVKKKLGRKKKECLV